MESKNKVEYRSIAKMLCKALPVKDEEYGVKVEEYLKVIKDMNKYQKTALKTAYIFSAKVPKEEREDLFQELALVLLKNRIGDERLAYTVARCDWLDWWRKYKQTKQVYLESIIIQDDGSQIEFGELLRGAIEYETSTVDDKLDAELIWNKLNDYPHIKSIVNAKLTGQKLGRGDGAILERFARNMSAMLTT
jgi:hypothetical protein